MIAFEVVPISESFRKNNMKFIKIYPTQLFLDRNGKIYARSTGGVGDEQHEARVEANLTKIIDRALDAN